MRTEEVKFTKVYCTGCGSVLLEIVSGVVRKKCKCGVTNTIAIDNQPADRSKQRIALVTTSVPA